jgi:hypothetical protein
MTSGLLTKTLLNHLDELVDPEAKEGHGAQLHELFTRVGCHMKVDKVKKKSKEMGKHDLTFKGLSFTGKTGEIVHRVREQVCAHMCPCLCMYDAPTCLHNS